MRLYALQTPQQRAAHKRCGDYGACGCVLKDSKGGGMDQEKPGLSDLLTDALLYAALMACVASILAAVVFFDLIF